MATQISLLPDEFPDEFIPDKKKRRRSLRAKVRRVIKTEGVYNYALMVQEILSSSDQYIEAAYKMSRTEITRLLYSEFGLAVAYQEDLESYLMKVQNIPGFGINKPKNNAKD